MTRQTSRNFGLGAHRTGWSETTRGVLTPHSPAGHALEISAIGDVTKPGPSATRSEPGDRRPGGLSAMRAGREFRPDAVVPDVMLPDFGGLEVLRRLRAEPARRMRAIPHRPGVR